MISVGSLFAGIGGFDLGLERTGGFHTRWFCEQDAFCQRVLAKHWPGVPCYPDIREVDGRRVEPVDLLCGGFPCQDISLAGKGAGIAGSRSGLWSEYARLIDEVGPRYVLVENVSALRSRGLDRVLRDLAALGFDAEWDCLPASAFGAPHQRDRIWIVAYPNTDRRGQQERAQLDGGSSQDPADRDSRGEHPDGLCHPLADAGSLGRLGWPRGAGVGRHEAQRSEALGHAQHSSPSPGGSADHWAVEPDVGRVADGVPARMDRLRSLGNALVPQIAEYLGRRILAAEAR